MDWPASITAPEAAINLQAYPPSLSVSFSTPLLDHAGCGFVDFLNWRGRQIAGVITSLGHTSKLSCANATRWIKLLTQSRSLRYLIVTGMRPNGTVEALDAARRGGP